MDSVQRSAVTPKKSRLVRTFAKVLHLRSVSGVAPVDGIHKVKFQEKVKDERKDEQSTSSLSGPQSCGTDDSEERERAAVDALVAKVFASVSSVKAAYAQLQIAQSPYDVDGIQFADQMVVSELKNLSELKQCYLKKQFDSSPGDALVLAEIQEQKSLLKTYEILAKKLESQVKLKDSEISFLREKLEEASKQNRLIEKRLNSSGLLSALDNLHLSGVSPSHFITVLHHAIRSIRSFVKLLVSEMELAGWDFDVAASAIQPGVVYWKPNDMCYAFESFVSREMFDSFHYPNFSLVNKTFPDQTRRKQHFFDRFTELKSMKTKEFLAKKPKSTFAKFVRAKYLKVVHPGMESSFYDNLTQRNNVNSGGFPETVFFASFAEMAKRVWLLHCLAFSFDPEASIFQVKKNSRFSEVYMKSVTEEAFSASDDTPESDPIVVFTVVPGFKIGKTVIQCQVYLSKHERLNGNLI